MLEIFDHVILWQRVIYYVILYNTELFFIYAKHTNIRCFKQLNKSKNKAFDLEEKS